MSKRLILILALAFVACIAVAAYAEVQNVKVSGDLTFEGVSRRNLILRKSDQSPLHAATGATFNQFDRRISGILSHVRVRIDADLTDNVSTTVRLLNERVWDEETNASTDIDLDLAYVSLKEFLYSPLSLTLGRQELMYGNGLIIGDVDTNGICAGHGTVALGTGTSTSADATGSILPRSLDDLSVRKAFDAIKATLNYDPLVVDLVYAKIDENAIDEVDDVDLYGVNANYALDKNTNLEGYYWEKRRKKAGAAVNTIAGSSEPANDDIVRTVGALTKYTGIKNLALSLEGAFQFGEKVQNTTIYPDDLSSTYRGKKVRRAYALQFMSQYNLADLAKKYNPMVKASYTLLSGEPYKSNEKHYHGWDAMFENQAGGTLFNKILGYSNAQLINIGASMKPMEDVKVSLDWSNLRLVKAYRDAGSLGAPTGVTLTGVLGDPTYNMKPGEKELGNEIDAALTYDYTEDVQLGLSMGWFMPGDAFDSDNKETATQVIGSMKVTF